MSNIPQDHPIRKMSPENAKAFMIQLNEISGKNKKNLEHKLHIQHRNTRHDVIDIVNEYNNEIVNHNDDLRKRCTTPPTFNNQGDFISYAKFDSNTYEFMKKKFDPDELTKRIMNMKQRKPKDGE